MKHTVVIMLILITILGRPAIAIAEESTPQTSTPHMCPICKAANDPQAGYPRKASSTLARGAINTAFGWTELLVQPTSAANSGGNLVVGIGRGVGNSVARTASGIGELLTFWMPKRKDRPTAGFAHDCPICFNQRASSAQSSPR